MVCPMARTRSTIVVPLILVALLFGTLLWANIRDRFVWTVIGVTFSFGLIGFYDDYLKLTARNTKGLVPRLAMSLP